VECKQRGRPHPQLLNQEGGERRAWYLTAAGGRLYTGARVTVPDRADNRPAARVHRATDHPNREPRTARPTVPPPDLPPRPSPTGSGGHTFEGCPWGKPDKPSGSLAHRRGTTIRKPIQATTWKSQVGRDEVHRPSPRPPRAAGTGHSSRACQPGSDDDRHPELRGHRGDVHPPVGSKAIDSSPQPERACSGCSIVSRHRRPLISCEAARTLKDDRPSVGCKPAARIPAG
jgi:hypothetical protein